MRTFVPRTPEPGKPTIPKSAGLLLVPKGQGKRAGNKESRKNREEEGEEIQELREYAEKKGLFFFSLAVKLETEMETLSKEEKEEIG